MKLRFICATHRDQLAHNASQAIYSCHKGYDTGLALADDGLIEEAVPQLGCAFETAEILLSKRMIDTVTAYEWLTYTALVLGENLAKLNYKNQALDVYLMTIDRLEQELLNNLPHQSVICAHLKTLHKHIQTLQFKAPKQELSMWLKQPFTAVH